MSSEFEQAPPYQVLCKVRGKEHVYAMCKDRLSGAVFMLEMVDTGHAIEVWREGNAV